MSAWQSLCCLSGSQVSCEDRARAGSAAGGLVVLRLDQHCLEAACVIQKMTTGALARLAQPSEILLRSVLPVQRFLADARAGACSAAPFLAGLQECLADSPMEGRWRGFCCKQVVPLCFLLLQVLMLSLLGSPREMVAMQALGTFGDIRGGVQNTGDTLLPTVWTLAW